MTAWTSPKTWTGEILSSANMNTYLRDNTLHLYETAADIPNRDVETVTSETTVSNTTTETTVFTVTVPANTLDSDDYLELTHYGRIQNDSGSDGRTLTFRIKLGSTTLATYIRTAIDDGDDLMAETRYFIKSDGSTSAQTSYGQIAGTSSSTLNLGTATEDATGALALTITVQWSATHASLVYTTLHTKVQHISV